LIFDLSDFESFEFVVWVGGVIYVFDIGVLILGGVLVGFMNCFDDGIDFLCMKIGEGDEIVCWYLECCVK